MSKRIKLQAIPINRTDYCQFLIVSQKNYSLTYYALNMQRNVVMMLLIDF
ncbi:hypothetical protein [Rickettsia endosymbiont of Gonocerus acuteangulatus]